MTFRATSREERFFALLRMTLAGFVILNPSTVTLSPSHSVILSNAKDLFRLRVNSVKSLRTSSVKDLWLN